MRKLLFSTILAMLSIAVIAQTSNIPYNLHFTAVARNPTTHVPETATIDVRLEVWHSSSSSAFVPDVFAYCEELHTIVPNSFGEFSANFGTDAAVICITGTTLANTAWEQGNLWYIIKYATGGGTFVPIDTGKFSSSTYSFAAHTAEKLVSTGTAPAVGSTLTWNGTEWAAAASASSAMPAGSIIAFAGTTPPTGWLFCDGSIVNSSSYPNLYAAIGTVWGNGNASAGSFNLPDARGRFLRGFDGTANNDPDKASRTAINTGGAVGNNVGSLQGDAIQGHWHDTYMGNYYVAGLGTSTASAYGNHTQQPTAPAGSSAYNLTPYRATTIMSNGVNGTPTVSNENRPKNVSVMYIIKY